MSTAAAAAAAPAGRDDRDDRDAVPVGTPPTLVRYEDTVAASYAQLPADVRNVLPDAARLSFEGRAYYISSLAYLRESLRLHLADVPGAVVPDDDSSFAWDSASLSWTQSFPVYFAGETGPDGGADDRWITSFCTEAGRNTIAITPAATPYRGADKPVLTYTVTVHYTPCAPNRSVRQAPPTPAVALPGQHVPTTAEILANPALRTIRDAPATGTKRARSPAAPASPPPAKRARTAASPAARDGESADELRARVRRMPPSLGALPGASAGATARVARMKKINDFASALKALVAHNLGCADQPEQARPRAHDGDTTHDVLVLASVQCHMRALDKARTAAAAEAAARSTEKATTPTAVHGSTLDTLLVHGYATYLSNAVADAQRSLAAATGPRATAMRAMFGFVAHLAAAHPPRSAKAFAALACDTPHARPLAKWPAHATPEASAATCVLTGAPLTPASSVVELKLKPRAGTDWYAACKARTAGGKAQVGTQHFYALASKAARLPKIVRAVYALHDLPPTNELPVAHAHCRALLHPATGPMVFVGRLAAAASAMAPA